MILLCGIPGEAPLARVRAALEAIGARYVLFDQRCCAELSLEFEIAKGTLSGRLDVGRDGYRLEDITGVYLRLMDDQQLPQIARESVDSPLRRHSRALHETLAAWCDLAPARVLNRPAPMGSNASKPYQAQLIRELGFAVPETLITNDPELVREFQARHGKVIYKSISAVRSIVQSFGMQDMPRLEAIRWCPTQFQAFVSGLDVRVHVVDSVVFATAIHSEATDYRYAQRQGCEARLEAIRLSDELADRCVSLARSLELGFAGIDLKLCPDGQACCFEVNPSPAFSYYEAHTGQPIARAVARHLAGA